jgi:hypothetical protein
MIVNKDKKDVKKKQERFSSGQSGKRNLSPRRQDTEKKIHLRFSNKR